ncbi:MAG: MBL fold metallo-hydrolase [Gammaproteobacteria bacterium]|nr:MBL fold metallo-hydrolase [Gammaproteobacteria bacterium]
MRSIISIALLLAGLAIAPLHAKAHDLMTLDELLGAFGWDFDGTEIRAEQHGDGLHVLFGLGGNIAVSIGDDGVLIVDDQFPQLIPKIQARIAELGGGAVDFAINTHWHFDHADGNLALGPQGTWLVAQTNSRRMMADARIINLVAMQYEQQAYPEDARPTITFDETMQFHFNGEQIDLVHFGPAHTTGDAAVIFRGRNAVHLGDVFNNSGYPFIDADNGGELDGMIHFCASVLAEIDEDTTVVPGHGPVTDSQALAEYIHMLESVRAAIVDLMAEGADLEAVLQAKPTAPFDAAFGDPSGFVNRAYAGLRKAGG